MSGVEILDNGTRVLTAPRAAFGTDALLLGRFAQPRRAERALDMCTPMLRMNGSEPTRTTSCPICAPMPPPS